MHVSVDSQLWVRHLVIHLPIAREGTDPEGVHQIRVASRRLRVWLRLGGLRVLVDDLRWFRNAASDVRDLDVLLAENQPEEFATFLHSQRAPAREKLLAELNAPRTAGLVAALKLLPPLSSADARKRLPGLARKVMSTAKVLLVTSPPIEGMHEMRKRVRVLRYTLEWLGERPTEIKELQDHLGWLGDLRVATTWYNAWPDRDAHPKFRERIEQRINDGITESRAAWLMVRKRVRELT